MTSETQPTLPLPDEWAAAELSPKRNRRVWPWMLAVLAVAALAVGAFFAAEWVVRDLVTKAVTQQIVSRFDVASRDDVDIDVPGTLLFQLAAGSIDRVTIAAQDATVGPVTGDFTVTVRDLPLWGDRVMSDGEALVELDGDQVRSLLSLIDGFPTELVELDEPDVAFSTALSLFGAEIPIAVALTPGAVDGDLALTPDWLEVAGARLTADDVRAQFGSLSDPVLQTWTLCIADQLPAGVPLTSVEVSGGELVAGFTIRSGTLHDPALQANGTCA